MEIKTIENINKNLFNIYENNNLPAIALLIDNNYYQISGFNNNQNKYIDYGKLTPDEAINLFTNFINNISFKIIIKIYEIAINLKADINNINIFKEKNIKGKNNFLVLEKSRALPSDLLDFIDQKNIPLKTISLIINQENHIINFISGYIKYNNDISVQNFRKFIEEVCDFKEIIPENYDVNFKFPDRLSQSHKEINENYNKLINSFKNIKINNLDNFETSKLDIAFNINNLSNYEKIIDILIDNKENIKMFYEILKKHGCD